MDITPSPNWSETYRGDLSASNLYRRRLCPGSAQAEAGLPEVIDYSAARDLGRYLHSLEEDPSASREDLKLLYQRALDKNQLMTKSFIQKVFTHLGISEPGECVRYAERAFFLNGADKLPITPLVAGHADEILYYPKVGIAFVFDSKFGRHPVTQAESNLQLRFYTVCTADDIGGVQWYAAIRQPLVPAPHEFHHVQYLPEDIEPARQSLLEIIQAAQDPNAKREPSIDACWFCKAKGHPNCPESLCFLKDVEFARIIKLKPAELEAMGDSVRMAGEIYKSWVARIRYIAETYPVALKEYGLSKQSHIDSIEDVPKAVQTLLSSGLLGVSEFVEVAAALLECCELSVPKLTAKIAKYRNLTESTARAALTDLGIVVSKPKERSVVKLKKY